LSVTGRASINTSETSHVIDAKLGGRPVLHIQLSPVVLAAVAARYDLARLPVPSPRPVCWVIAMPCGASR
jgi:hypothetical protein